MSKEAFIDPAGALHGVTVGDVMTRGLVHCTPETPVGEVAALMHEHRVHSVVVSGFDAGNRLIWALISDHDLIRAAIEGQGELRAEDIAATEPLTVLENESLERAAHLMIGHEITHLLVTKAGFPVGMVSSLDVARALARGVVS